MSEQIYSLAWLARVLRGPFNFLIPNAGEIFRLMPEHASKLPRPQGIYLADDSATPIYGFPILGQELEELRRALGGYLRSEEEVQVRIKRRQSHDPGAHQAAWETYRNLLTRATENVTTSSYGRQFPDIFWLQHSFDVGRLLKETPMRVTRLDTQIGREHGGAIKYAVFFKFLDRVLALTYDLVNRLAEDTEEVEQELFPALLSRMRDNVLIFTEDHISRDLAELTSYFQDNLRIDGRDLRYRMAKLGEWHADRYRRDQQLRSAVQHLVGEEPPDPQSLFKHSGYVTHLSTLAGYNSQRLLSPVQVQVWEKLLVKLKEFELFHALRRLVIPLESHQNQLFFRERALNRTWVGPSRTLVSNATRPMDFMAPWVVDPQVSRFGMIYDITDFSHIVTVLRRAGTDLQDRSFRQMFRFQRRVNRQAAAYRLKLEKYLGDGAFYSAREGWRMLVVAIQIQRFYRRALDESFPFDRGMRIALNHGTYRLLPIQGSGLGGPDRYEFFGHGVVELTRLTTGKSMREIEEIKILLANLGYKEEAVRRFFAPLATKQVDLTDKEEEARRFHAYINRNGKLVNEGIVATQEYIQLLAQELDLQALYRVQDGPRAYVGMALEVNEGRLYVGMRKLGTAKLKGLDPLPTFELVDGAGWDDLTLQEIEGTDLLHALDREYAQGVTEAGA